MSHSLTSSIAKTQEIDKALLRQTGTLPATLIEILNDTHKHTCNDASSSIVPELNKQYWS